MRLKLFIFSLAGIASLNCAPLWACGPIEDQLLFRVDPPKTEVTFVKGITQGGNNCVEKDHTWKGPKILMHGKVVDGLGCPSTYYIYCNDVTVSDTDDPSLSQKIYLPYSVPNFPDGFRISKDKFEDTKGRAGKGCVDVVLAIGDSANYGSCLKQIKYLDAAVKKEEPQEKSKEKEDQPIDPSEIVFPGDGTAPTPSSSPQPVLGPYKPSSK